MSSWNWYMSRLVEDKLVYLCGGSLNVKTKLTKLLLAAGEMYFANQIPMLHANFTLFQDNNHDS